MKPIIVFLMMISSMGSFAQYGADERNSDLHKYNEFKKMKGAGIGMTFLGAAVAIVGLANVHATVTSRTGNSPYYHTPVNSGEIIASLGAAVMGSGITLWAIGGRKSNFYREKLQLVSLHLQTAPHRAGVVLTYHF
jgi:hypothetical protein